MKILVFLRYQLRVSGDKSCRRVCTVFNKQLRASGDRPFVNDLIRESMPDKYLEISKKMLPLQKRSMNEFSTSMY